MIPQQPQLSPVHGQMISGPLTSNDMPRDLKAPLNTAVSSLLDSRKPIELPDAAALLRGVCEEYGGIEAMAKDWARQIQIGGENRPGSKTVLDSYRDLARLLIKASEQSAAEVDRMDEEELRSYLTDLVLSRITD